MGNALENIQEARKGINKSWDTLVACNVPDEVLAKLNEVLQNLHEAEEEIGIFFSGQI